MTDKYECPECFLYTNRCIKCSDYKNENTEMTFIKGEGWVCNDCIMNKKIEKERNNLIEISKALVKHRKGN